MARDAKIREVLKDYDNGVSHCLHIQRTDFRQICSKVVIQTLDDSDPFPAVQESLVRLKNHGFTIVHGPFGQSPQKQTLIVCS
jgi:hypothetical protein